MREKTKLELDLTQHKHDNNLLKERSRRINLKVGATFYYPNGCNFITELVGRRAKIIEIGSHGVKSRLIDSNGDFIGDVVWNGSIDSAINYRFEEVNLLQFKFNK